jgi:hypothetical protein
MALIGPHPEALQHDWSSGSGRGPHRPLLRLVRSGHGNRLHLHRPDTQRRNVFRIWGDCFITYTFLLTATILALYGHLDRPILFRYFYSPPLKQLFKLLC